MPSLEEIGAALIRETEGSFRPGTEETPARFAKAWEFWTSGYKANPADVMKTFEDGAAGVDEMVFQGAIPIFSMCEHHMAPFFGYAHVAYIPDGKIIGLSKMSRLIEVFARRLQVQERLTNQVADMMNGFLKPARTSDCFGVGVVMQCRHLCMESRGIQKVGTVTTTSALRGSIRNKPEARAEFLAFVRDASPRSLI